MITLDCNQTHGDRCHRYSHHIGIDFSSACIYYGLVHNQMQRLLHNITSICLLLLLISSCILSPAAPTQLPTDLPTATASATLTPTQTATFTPTSSITPTVTPTPTITRTPTQTQTPTQTLTPSITPSPTFAFPTLVVKMQANCRYGPAKAYLYAWGMYAGDTATVWGRNDLGTWLWIQPDKIKYQCWIAASVVEVTGNIFSVYVAPVRLPHSVLYGPPTGITAVRNGDSVAVSWQPVNMTEDDNRGYMIEANLCQNGNLVWMAVATMEPAYTFTDETNCTERANAQLYTVEKHGYSDPVPIPWP